MTRDDVDLFLAAPAKTLPALPDWESRTSRLNERRCYLPITVDGRVSNVHLEMTVMLDNESYLVMNLLAPTCVSRLCLSLEHFDRKQGELIPAPHWHPWPVNRPSKGGLPKNLATAESLVGIIATRDEAFPWFLDRLGIGLPSWPFEWPKRENLF
ncbi:hypothetical protein [Novosphingobium aquae]|uniref:Uncharacterized protein n=1 Tax=Novosphingobium aquae TaxID=3133435 RepID=A0ABU8S9H4_9SPHN